MSDLLRRLAAATEPRPGVVDRLRARVAPPSAGPLLRALDEGESDATLAARLRAGRAGRGATRPWRWLVGGAGLLAVVWWGMGGPAPEALPERAEAGAERPEIGAAPTAVSTAPENSLAVGAPVAGLPGAGLPGAGPVAGVAPPAPDRRGAAVAAIRAPVVAEPAPPPSPAPPSPAAAPPAAAPPAPDPLSTLTLPEGVRAERSGRVATVRWEVGTLDAGLGASGLGALRVETREAHVALTDGAVTVTRDRLGTRISTRAGVARVACAAEAERELVPGEVVECLPTRALGWLGRASALREGGATAETVLLAVDRGLAFGVDDPAFGELVALRVDVLRGDGDLAGARAAAALYPSDGPRAAEMARLEKP